MQVQLRVEEAETALCYLWTYRSLILSPECHGRKVARHGVFELLKLQVTEVAQNALFVEEQQSSLVLSFIEDEERDRRLPMSEDHRVGDQLRGVLVAIQERLPIRQQASGRPAPSRRARIGD
jgi:hypothetical protein